MNLTLFISVLLSLEANACPDGDQVSLASQCSESETGIVENLLSNTSKRDEYCLVKDDCGTQNTVVSKNSVPLNTSQDLLKEITTQKLEDLFDEIAVVNQSLDDEFTSGSLDACSIKKIDDVDEKCREKLVKLNITSKSISDSLKIYKDGTAKDFSPKCWNGNESLYLRSLQEQNKTMAEITNDKRLMKQLKEAKSDDEFFKFLKSKFEDSMDKLQQPRVKQILNSREQFESYINNDKILSKENKKVWAKDLASQCTTVFSKLTKYLCDKVPSENFVFNDYKLNKEFHLTNNKNFKTDYCASDKKGLDLSDPFSSKTIIPDRLDSFFLSTQATNNAICPIKDKCSKTEDVKNCLKNECSAIVAKSSKLALEKKQKTFCQDLFDFKKDGEIKNEELVNFLAVKKSAPVIINGVATVPNESKLMDYFLTPSKASDNNTDKKSVASKNDDNDNDDDDAPKGFGIKDTKTSSTGSVNFPTTSGNVVSENTNQNSIRNKNNSNNQNSSYNNAGAINTSAYDKTIAAQNELLDRLERAKNENTTNKTGTSSKSDVIQNKNTTASSNTAKKVNNGISSSDITPINDVTPTPTSTQNTTTNTTDSKKTTDRNISSNTTSPKDTRGNSTSPNLAGTSLEHKNNISSSVDVSRDGQFKVTLKNIDYKTLNMELFKDEIKKQAKDAIDRGVPFVISIINNGKEITINMTPKINNGRITYVPIPQDESDEAKAFSDKLVNSFYADTKTKIKIDTNPNKASLTELEKNLVK